MNRPADPSADGAGGTPRNLTANPEPAALPEALESRYPMECCVCGASLAVAPSISMHLGLNQGEGTCPGCRTILHLEIAEGGGFMICERADDHDARTQGTTAADA